MCKFEKYCIKSRVWYNYTMQEIYNNFQESEIDREGFEHIPYEIYLYNIQEFGSEQIYFRSQQHFENLIRDRKIIQDYQNKVPTKYISQKYGITTRRVQQIVKQSEEFGYLS